MRGGLWWEGFSNKVDFELGIRAIKGVMDNKNGEFIDGDEQPEEGSSEYAVGKLVQGCQKETGSLFQRQGKAY